MYLKEKKVVFKAPLKPIELKITDPVSTRYRTVENFNKLKKKSWTVQNYQHEVRLKFPYENKWSFHRIPSIIRIHI